MTEPATRVAFPQAPEDFDNDPRVSFSQLDSKYILEDKDGSEWEYDDKRQKWIPLVRLHSGPAEYYKGLYAQTHG